MLRQARIAVIVKHLENWQQSDNRYSAAVLLDI